MIEALACHPLGKKISTFNRNDSSLISVPRYCQSQHAAFFSTAKCQGELPHILFARHSHQLHGLVARHVKKILYLNTSLV